MQQHPIESRWRRAIQSGELGVWDLRPELETVHYSPQWKQRLGFPEPHSADSTHFWRCRVHPEDLPVMLAALRAHVQGERPGYEAAFRLRSNGSGYRQVYSRGRVIQRSDQGRALRMVGTMIDLTPRPPTPQDGLPQGPRGVMAGQPMSMPFHQLLSSEPPGADAGGEAQLTLERHRVLALVNDLLLATVQQLEGLPA